MPGFVISVQKLPGVNFEATPSLEDLKFLFDEEFADQQRHRLQLAMAYQRSVGPQHGIVDEFNPTSATADSSRPFLVEANAGNDLLIDVYAGVAVTKAGNIIVLTETQSGITPASEAQDVVNVVFVEYETIPDPDTITGTKYLTSESVLRIVPGDDAIVKTVTLADYQDITIFTPDRLNDVVVLGLVTKVQHSSGSGYILDIDMSNNTSAYVRPWFSAVDQEHRSFVGTGSDDTPHKMAVSDLSEGEMTIFQLGSRHGHIVSRDLDVPGCPGKLCQELVDSTRILEDTTGAVTGSVGRWYAKLISYPIRITGAKSVDDSDNDVAVSLVQNSNVISLRSEDWAAVATDGFVIHYTASTAVEPPTLVLTGNVLEFGEPEPTRELVITGGKGSKEIPTKSLTLANCGPFPKDYRVWMDRSKQFVLGPQVVACAHKIDPSVGGVGTAQTVPEFALYGPAYLRVGLTGATPGASLNFEVKLNGKDADGVSLSETLVFDSTNYAPVSIPTSCTTEPAQYLVTTNVFSELTNWEVPTRVFDGPNSVIMVWADIGPTQVPALDDALPVAHFRWNGQAVCRVRDIRPIGSMVGQFKRTSAIQEQALATLAAMQITEQVRASGNFVDILVASDDFSNPHWIDHTLSKVNRHSDGLVTVFEGDSFAATFTDDSEYVVTRAIEMPNTGTQDRLTLFLFSDTTDGITRPVLKAQYRITFLTDPDTSDFASSNSAYCRSKVLALHPGITGVALKVQFRMRGSNLRGFMALMRTDV